MFLSPHAPETLLGSFVFGRRLCSPTAISPAFAVDEELHGPERCVVLEGGVVEFPFDPLVVLLHTQVELAEVAGRSRVGGHREGPWRGPRRRVSCTGSTRPVVRANRFAMPLTHDAVRLVHIRPEELIQPDLHRP